jgi:ferredoxin
VFSPNSKLREYVVPQKPVEEQENQKPKSYSMTWAQRLKRVFAIDIEKCEKCGGPAERRPVGSLHRLKILMSSRRY